MAVHAWDLLKEAAIIFITIVWPQVKQQGGNTDKPINRKLDLKVTEKKKVTEHGPTHQNKTQFATKSVSHQEASISILSFSIRGQKERKPQSQKN